MEYRREINSEGGVEVEAYRKYAVFSDGSLSFDEKTKRAALEDLINALLDTNNRLFLIFPTPEFAINIAKTNWLYFKSNSELLDTISTPSNDYRTRNKFVVNVFNSFAGRDNYYPVTTSDIFCDSYLMDRCVAQYQTVPFFYDDDHLSDVGAQLVINKFINLLTKNNHN
jgi:hypothetical protein